MELGVALLQIREQDPHEDEQLLGIHPPDRRRGGRIRVQVGQGHYPVVVVVVVVVVAVGGSRRSGVIIGIIGSVGIQLHLNLRLRGDVPQQLGMHLPQVRGGGGRPCLYLLLCLLCLLYMYLLLLLLRRGGRRGQSLELGLLVRVLGLRGDVGGGELHHGGDAVPTCPLRLLIRLLEGHVGGGGAVAVAHAAQVGHGLGRGRMRRRRVRRRVGPDRHGDDGAGGAAGTASSRAGSIGSDAADPQVVHEGHGGDGAAAVRAAPARGQMGRQLGDEGAVLLHLRQLLLVMVVVLVVVRVGIEIPRKGLLLLRKRGRRKRGGRIRRGMVGVDSLRERRRRERQRRGERAVVLLGMRLLRLRLLLLRKQEGQEFGAAVPSLGGSRPERRGEGRRCGRHEAAVGRRRRTWVGIGLVVGVVGIGGGIGCARILATAGGERAFHRLFSESKPQIMIIMCVLSLK